MSLAGSTPLYVQHRRRVSVIEMDSSFHTLGSEYDNFLFASIGDDTNGLPLSVVSALARRDIDPWQEAAELARLPEEAATRRLASLIGTLPNMPPVRLASTAIAVRLVALLPRRRDRPPPTGTDLVDGSARSRSAAMYYVIFYATLLALVLGVHYFVSSNQPPAPTDNSTAEQNSRPDAH
jgi:hypothetical protein